ncbi:helicase HerA-like domain-containing protein [Hypericibacter sp.]|uniref:helicase HerA-like domain-containing protein n=1 Tax=Hypericibacter sp. TaxID=2705401 RepID=UPI003D6CBA6C
MPDSSGILVAKGDAPRELLPRYANRHGLITGATGTGKTVTLQVIAEGLAARGVPVFMADVKGDLAGLSQAGAMNPKLQDRLTKLEIADHAFRAFPVIFWDLFGEQGHPVRATVSDLGPLLLGRLLDLNEVQTGVLNLVFKVADDQGLLLLDLKDLQAMMTFVASNAKELTTTYGNVSAATVGTIQRGLLQLESQAGDKFFGEPALELADLMLTDPSGTGAINILAADKLMQTPRLYATFLLWLLSELFENLPEMGDPEIPKLVFFFDEAHLLFNDAPKALLEKVEQVVRLVRSKGVGVFFVTQNPLDVPDTVLGQLGNRVQHALRAFTPRDQKAVKAAAQTFRQNPKLDTATVIMELGVGEALISFLEAGGIPAMVDRAFVLPPCSRLGAITPDERRAIIAASPVKGHYEQTVDRASAFETLRDRAQPAAAPSGSWRRPGDVKTRTPTSGPWGNAPAPSPAPAPQRQEKSTVEKIILGDGRRQGLAEAMAKSAVRQIGSSLGRQILRGVLGSILKG